MVNLMATRKKNKLSTKITPTDRRGKGKAARKAVSWDDIRAKRAIDPLINLAKHHRLNPQQRMAAATYRRAYETVSGSGIHGTLGNDGAGGGTDYNRTPPPAILEASEKLRLAKHLLGEDSPQLWVVAKVVGVGMTIDDAALSTFGAVSERRRHGENCRYASRLLQDGLSRLGAVWHPISGKSRMRSSMAPDARPVDTGTEEFGLVRVAHGGSGRVEYSSNRRKP